jgi:N-acetylglucosamine-6-phosphate deacetylase
VSELRGRLLLNGELVHGRISFAEGRIVSVEREAGGGQELPVIAPGLVDMHLHGFGGHDPLIDLQGMASALVTHGTTAFQPTLFPAAPKKLGEHCAQLAEAETRRSAGVGARNLGAHLEGPFVNPLAAGALPMEDLHAPSVAGLRAILGPNTGDGRRVRTITVAPELSGSAELIQECVRSGVRISMGHSRASGAEARAGARAGATGATHLYNAMTGIHHRDAGLAGIALTDALIFAEIIGDLVHVQREAFEIALAARGPDGLCLVSDALAGAGTGCEVFHCSGREHLVIDGTAYYPPAEPGGEPQLAGCASSQLQMVRKLTAAGVCSLAEALTMASSTPARALGLEAELGVLAPGARADLVVLEGSALTLKSCYVGGEQQTL